MLNCELVTWCSTSTQVLEGATFDILWHTVYSIRLWYYLQQIPTHLFMLVDPWYVLQRIMLISA